MADKVDKEGDDIFNAIDELEDSDNSEDEVDQELKNKRHKRLLSDLSEVTGVPHKRPALRSGPGVQVSEHLWSYKAEEGKDDKVKLNELLEAIPHSSSLGSVRKKIQKLEKSKKTLDTPLNKTQVEKVQRTVGYQNVSKEVSKWSSTVIQNREAENLQFPLNAYEEPKPTTKSVAVNFKPKNSLEKEIAAVLKGSSSVLERNNKELTEQEEKALQAVDLQEALERRKELQKMRALQSYYETKCKRTKKIKSKKFRKVQRKIDQKKEEKNKEEMTEAEKSEMANEAETQRAMERAQLRHRNTSKWAKKMMAKDNKSVEEKQLIHDQLKISRQLTEQKVDEEESEKEEEVEPTADFTLLKKTTENNDNPWLLGEVTQTKKGHKVNGKDRLSKEKRKSGASETREDENDSSDLESENENEFDIKDIADEQQILAENENKLKNQGNTDIDDYKTKTSNKKKDVNDFIASETKALDVNTIFVKENELDFARSKEQQSIIREAFAHDDVREEFAEDKERVKEQRKPKSVDLSLPGWGEWAGAGINNEKILNRKRKKFKKVGKKSAPSKDEKLSHVIINETRNEKFAANQVSEVPFPYSSKDQFERSIRQPIGKTWNTPSLTAKLIQPRVSTLIGTIIEPIKKPKVVKKEGHKKDKKLLSNEKNYRKS